MHDCIREWTRKWDPALMTSTVGPNRRQGVIAMLSGGKVGRFRDPTPRLGTKVKATSGAERRKSSFSTFPRILGPPP